MKTEKVRWVRGTVSVISALRLGMSLTAFPAPCLSSLLGFVGGAMRRLFILLALALPACGSEPTSTICTREDVGTCSVPSTAEFDVASQEWFVTLRTAVTEPVEYEEKGHLCVLARTSCLEEICRLFAWDVTVDPWEPAYANGDEAIAACRETYGR